MRRLISVAIVVLIILLGSGLLVGAITHLRAAAAQAQCRNNLRQVGLALHNYHDTYNHFPSGTMSDEGWPMEKRRSWLFSLLPFMESMMDPFWRSASKKPWDAEESRFFNAQPIRSYLCPSSSFVKEQGGYGVTHYMGVGGIGLVAPSLAADDPNAGLFGYERSTRLEDVKDGRTTTLMVVETAMANGPWAAGGPATLRGLGPDGVPYLGRGAQFGGLHRSRVTQAVFVDASVRRVPELLAPQVFEALATIAGREEVEAIPEN